MIFTFNPKNLAAFLICASLLGVGCSKEKTPNEAENLMETMADDAEADITFNQVSDDVGGINDDIGFTQTDIGSEDQPTDPTNTRCYTVTITKLTANDFPKQVVIDFGTGCLGRDGKTRKGKVITVYTGRLRVPGSKATTTFDGFYVNAVHVEGTHTIQNNSTSSVRVITRTVENGKLSRPNGNYILWNATHTNTQVAGLGTPNFHFDDAFSITGNVSAENSRNGVVNTWSRSITSPLQKKATCRWFDAGTVSITRKGQTGTLDYGTGTCDNKATITFNNNSRTITLP
jgi:hypothetical protein